MRTKLAKPLTVTQLSLASPPQPRSLRVSHLSFVRSPVVTTAVFDTYWRFAAERQRIFFQRATGVPGPWTPDRILQRFRFTNAYRAADRVSQFLIRDVQSQGPQDARAVFFRTILFKLFNRIDTWRLLESAFGVITPETYQYEAYDRVLYDAMARGRRIYSAAYTMPSGGAEGSRKHQVHLRLLESMMKDDLPARLADCGSMAESFALLRSYQTIGDFLAYQYVTDLNYSKLLDFSEMEFVSPGPGARSGIQKCFADRGSYSEADLIRWMAEHQADEFCKRGIEFCSLWGRPLQLIDCQNLFCEVDKYARVHHPDIFGLSKRVRIKQEYRYNPARLDYWLPPKWGLNERIAAWSESQSSTLRIAPAAWCATEGA
ncbi:MAG: putative DNA base hypermodification protein [Bryobacteraceae bacterium]|nr:putative DNA base hypermodification protein [Bryobacteraceae bacterium]